MKRGRAAAESTCPYLVTVDRRALDFDRAAVCEVSGAAQHVYACLVCGAYVRGRGPGTPATAHALARGHHVFLAMDSLRTYCLPDDYEIDDPSLDDVRGAARPAISRDELRALDAAATGAPPRRALDGAPFRPGYVGLNAAAGAAAASPLNAVTQLLLRVTPLRDAMLLAPLPHRSLAAKGPSLATALALLAQKVWNPRALKRCVNPQQLAHAVADRRRAQLRGHSPVAAATAPAADGARWDPLGLYTWLVAALAEDAPGWTKPLRGRVRTVATPSDAARRVASAPLPELSVRETPFVSLRVDLPEGAHDVPLETLLAKYDGARRSLDPATGEYKQYVLLDMPEFLVLQVRRFRRELYFAEKNGSVVALPLDNMLLGGARYSLAAAVSHEGSVDAGVFHAIIRVGSSSQWLDICDVDVEPLLPQQVSVCCSVLLLYAMQPLQQQQS